MKAACGVEEHQDCEGDVKRQAPRSWRLKRYMRLKAPNSGYYPTSAQLPAGLPVHERYSYEVGSTPNSTTAVRGAMKMRLDRPEYLTKAIHFACY